MLAVWDAAEAAHQPAPIKLSRGASSTPFSDARSGTLNGAERPDASADSKSAMTS